MAFTLMSVVRRRPQLSLEELHYFRWTLGGVLALLSVWTLFHLEASLWPLGMIGTIAILASIFQPRLPGWVPPLIWRLGVPAIAIFFAVDVMMNEMIPAFVRLNTMLVLHRALSYRRRREDLQLLVLCLFLIVVTGVLTISLTFAAQILLFAAVAMVFLFVLNIVHDAAPDSEWPAVAWTLLSRRRFAKRLWRVFDLRLVGLGVGLFVAVIGISTIIFLAIPRLEMGNPFSLMRFNTAKSITGFSENIALGEVTNITKDHSIAMRVDVQGAGVVPAEPYWRMVVLDEYGNGMFRVSRAVTGHAGVRPYPSLDIAAEWAGRAGGNGAGSGTYVVFLEGGISRHLPLPSRFQYVRFKEFQDIVPNKVFRTYATEKQSAVLLSMKIKGADFDGVVPDPDFESLDLRSPTAALMASTVHEENFAYRFLSYPATTRAVPVSPEARAYLRNITDEITSGHPSAGPREFAALACKYLADTHHYSLNVNLGDGAGEHDPVIRWMKRESGGHCEFFAAAFTLLSRTAGFPTRAVTGFKGGSWNAYEDYFMVRNSNAHAWCEVYDGEGAWFRVDPTSGDVAASVAAAPVSMDAMAADRSASAFIDSLRMIWYRRIVSFDQGSQRVVAGSIRRMGDVVTAWTATAGATLWTQFKAWASQPWTLRSRGDLLLVAVGALIISVAMRRFGIGTSDIVRWFRRGDRPVRHRAGDFILRLQARMERKRKPRRWDDRAALEIMNDLTVIRYGRPESWPDPWRVFRAARRIL